METYKVRSSIVEIVKETPRFVNILWQIQFDYVREYCTYKDVERKIDNIFRDVLIGFCSFFESTSEYQTFDCEHYYDFDTSTVVDLAIEDLTQCALSGGYTLAGPTAIDETINT